MPPRSAISSGPSLGAAVSAAVMAERFSVGVGGAEVVGVLHRPRLHEPSPCVVACHGMGASKDSDKDLLLARQLPPARPARAAWGCSARASAASSRSG